MKSMFYNALYLRDEEALHASLNLEPNVVLVPDVVDSYHNLTLKEIPTFDWIAKQFPNMRWLVKVDDDVYAACVPNHLRTDVFSK